MTPIPHWIAEYIGLPYAEKGRDRTGLDCWGLVRLVLAEQFGITVPSYADGYTCALERREVARLIAGVKGSWDPVERDAAAAGDVLLLRQAGAICHVGLVVATGLMLHTEVGIGAAVERYDSPKWAARVVSIHRWGMASA